MIVYVCKVCGRAIKSPVKPNFCYADRTSSLENISDEDSIKMQLFRGSGSELVGFGSDIVDVEFPGDIQYNPINGDKIFGISGHTLSQYQDEIMKRVRA